MATTTTDVSLALQRIPPFPTIAQKLMALTARPNVSFTEVSNLLQSDPGYSIEVLRLANSAGFAARQEVRSILMAISLLGVERLQSLVITVGLSRFAKSVAKTEGFQSTWRHSMACALICEDIAPSFHLLKAECYSLGLLHDIGRFALLIAIPREYHELIATVNATQGSLAAAERERFGLTHCELGQSLFRKWRLPQCFEHPICCHHDEPRGTGHTLQNLVYAACAAANRNGFTAGPPEPVDWEMGVLDNVPAEARPLLDSPNLAISLAERINRIECAGG